ncbi:Long-chain-fatty-acid--CoA ligase [Patulibacter medicamentivorans]|uniref:Long-chain-fatty-acid--CoA ligase n=1 Tax=Patulibacter medicamentivorans TaxID=1097667 RepID=H0EAN0_9ACTN|nr:MlaD family protein [Patulibacter medicamentivorans]EHN09264.1 Long-chain-fatty-acid--CoA ligase [Patulibacter medicamentivorans]
MSRRGRKPVHQRSVGQIVRSNVRWGLATVLFALAVVYLVFGGPLPGGGAREVHVVTRDAGALRVGPATKVRIGGVDVGSVSDIKAVEDHPGLSEITVELKDDTPVIRRDATVKIRPRLFLEGNFFLDINPGSPGAPPLGDNPIPPGATTIHVAFDEVFSAFDGNARDNFKQALKGFGESLKNGGGESLGELIRASPPALGDFAVVSEATRGERPGDLRRLVRSTGDLLHVFDQHEASLRGVLHDGRRTFQAFADSQADLRATFAELDRTTARAMPALAKLNAVIPEARALVRDARPLVRRLPATLDLANPALNALLSLARSGKVQGLLAELRPTLRSLSVTADPLGTVMDDLRPVSTCLWKNALPVLNAPVPDGALSTGMPVYRELLSSLIGLGSSTSNFDANGPWTRYIVGLGNQLLSFGGGSRDLQARADQPIAGSTPTPVSPPPFRGDVPCESQPVPSLRATPHAYVGKQTTDPIDRGKLSSTMESLLRTAKSMTPAKIKQLEQQLQSTLGDPAAKADGASGAATGASDASQASQAAAQQGVGR